jgi:hypothetical protein
MLGFRFACERHQTIFAAFVRAAGCNDTVLMEKVRLRLLRWLTEKYPALVLEQYNQGNCLGCALESAHLDIDEVQRRTLQITKSVLNEMP